MITTTHGPMDESLLEKREGVEDYPDGTVSWVEYWKDGEMVHRSANIALKGREIRMETGTFG